ncbi:DNA translocase FtsK [Halobacillus massiliensis]|uniref:DNA translocase FtsK n=1 Tax=Halobacillus massiliensis TaxID=1926286 RepID=UPI001FE72E87|nr:DNA translocase FtsK [Halobacillus massiliensis]
MWNNFKNKLKQFLEPEDEQNYTTKKNLSPRKQDNQEQKESVANTRMTYKYPKQGNFRFPVIPDQQDSKHESNQEPNEKPEEKPPYKERQPRRQNRSYPSYVSQDYNESYRRKKKKPEIESKQDEPAVPFTPSNVPSPIFGFQPRNTPKSNAEKLFGPREESGKTASMEQARIDEEHWQSVRQRVLNSKPNMGELPVEKAKASQPSSIEQARIDEEHWQAIRQRVLGKIGAQKERQQHDDKADNFHNDKDDEIDQGTLESAASIEKEKQQEKDSIDPENSGTVDNLEENFIYEDEPEHEPTLEVPYLEEESVGNPSEEISFYPEEAEENQGSIAVQTEDDVSHLNEPEDNHWPEVPYFNEEDLEEHNEEEEPVHEAPQLEYNAADSLGDDDFYQFSTQEQESSVEELQQHETSREAKEQFSDGVQHTEQEAHKDDSASKMNIQKETRTQERKLDSRTTERRSVPFNVLMTPRDKRTRDKQKKTLNSLSVAEQPSEEENKEYFTPLHLLNDKDRTASQDEAWVKGQMELLETTLRQFHVRAKVVHAMKGPAVTRFEVQPEPGVKVSKITNLSDDIKLSMAARDIRIEAPIPGKQAVGIEVPNQKAEMVGLQEIFESETFTTETSPLTVGLGLDIGGDAVVTNLKKMPHGLIAGATGSGKSVCINTILISMLYKAHHDDVKFLLIDPKMVELAPYNGLPHLVSPVITDVKAATTALKWAVKEMEERYEKFVAEGARDVERYNEKMLKQGRASEKLPYLVIVIDELADLMMVSPQDVEDSICRIAQKARACGIHLLLATQRPSVDVITGLIKANIPTRIAFSVSSQIDSRTIIDTGGAEKLLGKGDMLFIENGSGQSRRIQGAFVSDDEIERITGYVKRLAPPNYLFEQDELIKQVATEEETDALFEEAVEFVLEHNGASASLLQRRFKVGYNRAARLIDQMAEYGIISESKGSKPRDILLTRQQVEEMKAR